MILNFSSPYCSRQCQQPLDAIVRLPAKRGEIAQAPDQIKCATAFHISNNGLQGRQISVYVSKYGQSHVGFCPIVPLSRRDDFNMIRSGLGRFQYLIGDMNQITEPRYARMLAVTRGSRWGRRMYLI